MKITEYSTYNTTKFMGISAKADMPILTHYDIFLILNSFQLPKTYKHKLQELHRLMEQQ